jgi:hypothetical protein
LDSGVNSTYLKFALPTRPSLATRAGHADAGGQISNMFG